MEPRLPTDQGFDVNVAGSFWGHPLKGYFSPYRMPNLEDGPKGEYLTDRLTSEAIQVMDDFSKQDKPWLLYMSYYTVHGPLHSKAEKTRKYAEKARQAKVKLKSPAYAGMVESLDENVGRMLDWLDEKELRKAREIAFEEIQEAATNLGGNAVVGIDIDYEVVGEKGGMLMVSVSGTAVSVR